MSITILQLIPLLTAIATLIFGLFVLLINRSSILHRVFFGLSLSASVWYSGNFLSWTSVNPDLFIFWTKIHFFGVAFISPCFYQMSVEFNELKRQKKIVPFVYLACSLLLLLILDKSFVVGSYPTSWGRHVLVGRAHSIFLFFWSIPVTFALINSYYGYRISTSSFQRQRGVFL